MCDSINNNSGVICEIIDFGDDDIKEKIKGEIIKNGNMYYLGNFVRKRILNRKKELDNAAKDTTDIDVILNYPVVYVHTWEDKENSTKTHYYVGETIDLVQRTRQHGQTGEKNPKSWQSRWIEAVIDGRAKSYYFSHRDMNKSLSLDVENCLIELLEEEDIKNENGRGNPQGNYSNKDLHKVLVSEIIRKLKCEQIDLNAYKWSQCDDMNTGFSGTKPVFKTIKLTKELIEKYEDVAEWKKVIDNSYGSKNVSSELFLDYPVIYMHVWVTEEVIKEDKKEIKKSVINTYVGETNNLAERTRQHYDSTEQIHLELIDGKLVENIGWREKKDSWKKAVNNGRAIMMVLAHPEFNKSVTLDIENRLIQYTIFTESSTNGRTNEQREYSQKEKMYEWFREIVDDIIVPVFARLFQKFNQNIYNLDKFQKVECIQEDSVFIAAPFLKPSNGTVNNGQGEIIKEIKNAVCDALGKDKNNRMLIAVRGSAGTGKTVLAAKLFFDLMTIELSNKRPIDCRFIVNHEGLYELYSNMSERWELGKKKDKDKDLIVTSTIYINQIEERPENRPDVVLVDEAHLLHKGGAQGYTKKMSDGIKREDQLSLIMKSANVVIVLYDPLQTTRPDRMLLDQNGLDKLCKEKGWDYKEFELSIQMRMECGDKIKEWISFLSSVNNDGEFPKLEGKRIKGDGYEGICDCEDYELRIYNDSDKMSDAIEEKKDFSCLLATYEWEYHKNSNDITILNKFFWHNTKEKNANSWTKHTDRNMVGAIHDIQGFDLRYAGVILGDTVIYENNKVCFSKKNREKELIHQGRLPENKEEAARLIANEVRVLLTRGKNGLFIYPKDNSLHQKMVESLPDK